VHRVPLYVPKKPSGLKRLLHLASFGCASLFSTMHIASRFKPDVIFAVAPALTSAVAALAGALVCNAKTWLHIQDWEVEAAFDLGLLKGAGSRKMALGVEGSLLRSFDRVSSIGPAMVQKIIEKGVASTRVFELRNWVDVDQTCVFESSNTRYRKELNISADEIVALYSGNMARKQGLEALADVARRLEAIKAPVTMVLCGAGPARADLESLCADLSNVKWLPLQSLDRLPELLGTADIHLLPQRAEAADLVLPSKLTGMLASGRPVLAMAEEGSGLAQEVKDCGVIVSADSQAMSDAILELAADAKTRARLGANARARAIDRWCRRTIIAEFSQSLYAKRPSISPNVGAHQSV
jgi:colanic acid biosynthesis glycosyl transferase WcaI